MTSSPLITIGITTYNAQDTVKRSLDSVLALDWSPLEILVLDDCSTDSTIEIIKSYVSDGYPIRILQNDQNRGLAYNRNRLCEEAKGEFFALHDDDDFCYPDRIKAQYDRIRAFEEETGIDKVFCFGDRLCINENGAQTIQLGVGRTGPAPHGLIFLKALLARRRPSKYVWKKRRWNHDGKN